MAGLLFISHMLLRWLVRLLLFVALAAGFYWVYTESRGLVRTGKGSSIKLMHSNDNAIEEARKLGEPGSVP